MIPSPWPEAREEDQESIEFFTEDLEFELPQEAAWREWITAIIVREECRLSSLNIIFCSDPFLLGLNQEFLRHDTLTDIITFPYAPPPLVEGEIYVSIDRVTDNAAQLQQPFWLELQRVVIHGVLHLCGYGDKEPSAKATMTTKEDEALALLPSALRHLATNPED